MDQEDEQRGYRWETEYEKTWEAIEEDEEGLLQPSLDEMVHRAKRKRILERKNLRLGMMRHIFIVIDMSKAMTVQDVKPSRIISTLKLLTMFLNEFIDQNPISQIGIIITRDKKAERITDLSGNINNHLDALKKLQDTQTYSCTGEPSLQNSLEMAIQTLRHMPSHTSKEVLILFGSLTTCDPGDINQTINLASDNNIRCSVIGLSAEIRICRKLAKQTKGIYDVILDDAHFKEVLYQHLIPPSATSNTESSLIRMGFPQFVNEGEANFPSLCVCHLSSNPNINTSGYFCPQCNSKYCDLPVECQICNLTLVSPAHLARSYHHLFPVETYQEFSPSNSIYCFSCNQLIQPAATTAAQCKQCQHIFCIDCDLFIHETMHFCPGCASIPSSN